MSSARTHQREREQVTAQSPPTVLVVEPSVALSLHLTRQLKTVLQFDAVIVRTCADAAAALEAREYLAVVTSRVLPDAPDGAAVDLALSKGVPTFVLTSANCPELHSQLVEKRIIDYFVKDGRCTTSLCNALRRIQRNPNVQILIVDDSRTFREMTKGLLDVARYDVLTAEDGIEGLEQLEAHPGISLVICDYEMPRMGAFEFIAEARKDRAKDELVIIGVSAAGATSLPSRFLKAGANDFLSKPFSFEELLCRVGNNITLLENIAEIRELAFCDALTGLRNRLYFFRNVPSRVREGAAVAMLDIDHFKQVNDTYGHAGGDAALRHIARIFGEVLEREGLIARFGGEEFCFFCASTSRTAILMLLEKLRAAIQADVLVFEGVAIPFTVSIGATMDETGGLDAMINRADALLYAAKLAGRNRVCDDIFEPRALAPTG